MSDVGLALRQVRYVNRGFWRNPASAFFTFAFPLLFLVIFTTLLGSGTTTVNGVEFDQSTYYVAGMASFAVITACYTNIAMAVTFQRDEGILKRIRGTPLPGWGYLTARVLHAVVVAIVLVTICAVFGRVFYDAALPTGMALVRTIAVVLVGAGSFAALALAVTAAIPNADAAPAIVNGTILPLLFISGVFFSMSGAPTWIDTISKIFPVRHFTDAFFGAYYGAPVFDFSWGDVVVVAAWGIAGLIVASRRFSWEPRA